MALPKNPSANGTPATPPEQEGSAERRKRTIPVALDRRRAENAATARKNSGRRRLIDPTTCERDYSDEEIGFMQAMEMYKRNNRRPFPTWSEVLEVLLSLGYRKVETASTMPGSNGGVTPAPAKG